MEQSVSLAEFLIPIITEICYNKCSKNGTELVFLLAVFVEVC